MSMATQQDSKKSGKQYHRPHQGRVNRDPDKRKRPLRPMELIPQGEAILIELDRMRFLTNSQVGELLFRQTYTSQGTVRSEKQFQETANQAIADLLDLGLVERINSYQTHRQTGNVFLGQINLLTKAGRDTVRAAYDRADSGETCRWTPDLKRYSYQKIDHELGINDVLIALKRGIWALGSGFDLLDWHDDDRLERQKAQTRFTNFTPDGWGVIATPDDRLYPIFVEVDRGTEVIISTRGATTDWMTKIARYGVYLAHRYNDDPFYASLGYDPHAMAKPIVLTVTTSAERRENMLNATARAGGAGCYWYAAAAEIFGTAQMPRGAFGAIMGSIWWRVTSPEPTSLRAFVAG